jgi:CheY-like chemotaxis protein
MIRQQIADPEPMGEKTAEALEQFRHTAERRAEDADFLYTPMPHGRVLVVDDLEINREVAKGMLEPYELNVDLVEGGEEAVELVRRGEPHYDLIFMDQMMPGMDGIEAVRIIREEIGTEYAKNIPVVALTANAMLGSEEMFLKEGFQGYLAKPIDLRDLKSVIVRFLPSEA